MPNRPDSTAPGLVLLVEDNPADVRLIKHAFSECDFDSRIEAVHDGEQALAFLRREGGYADAKRPDLVLLDLNLPRMDGREVLEAMKSDPALRSIPVVVLSSSNHERDVRFSYEHAAQSYIQKPFELNKYTEIVCDIERYWLHTVMLPPLSSY